MPDESAQEREILRAALHSTEPELPSQHLRDRVETLAARIVYELEPKLNAALAEAAMARQETAAQSARIDRALEEGQRAADGLRSEINAANARAYTHASKMATSLDESYEERCDALSKRLDALEEHRSTMARDQVARIDAWELRLRSWEDTLARVTEAVSQMPAPKLAAPTSTRIKVNFYDRAGKLLDWVIPDNHAGVPFYPHREVLQRTHSISVEYSHGR